MNLIDHLSYYFSKKYNMKTDYPFDEHALDNVMVVSVKNFDQLAKASRIKADQNDFMKEVFDKFKEFNEEKFHNNFLGYLAIDQRDKAEVVPVIIYGKAKEMRSWLNQNKNNSGFKFQ